MVEHILQVRCASTMVIARGRVLPMPGAAKVEPEHASASHEVKARRCSHIGAVRASRQTVDKHDQRTRRATTGRLVQTADKTVLAAV